MHAKSMSVVIVALLLGACAKESPQVLGTLEWDRITLPAPVAEKIVRIDVREGQQVAAGAPLLQLELTRTQSQLAAAQAQAQQSRDALAELQAGPRSEQIAQARAAVAAAQASARDAMPSVQLDPRFPVIPVRALPEHDALAAENVTDDVEHGLRIDLAHALADSKSDHRTLRVVT